MSRPIETLGMIKLRECTPEGKCPLCLEPLGKSTRGFLLKLCGDEECYTAYQRYYRRDYRNKEREKANDKRKDSNRSSPTDSN